MFCCLTSMFAMTTPQDSKNIAIYWKFNSQQDPTLFGYSTPEAAAGSLCRLLRKATLIVLTHEGAKRIFSWTVTPLSWYSDIDNRVTVQVYEPLNFMVKPAEPSRILRDSTRALMEWILQRGRQQS